MVYANEQYTQVHIHLGVGKYKNIRKPNTGYMYFNCVFRVTKWMLIL